MLQSLQKESHPFKYKLDNNPHLINADKFQILKVIHIERQEN